MRHSKHTTKNRVVSHLINTLLILTFALGIFFVGSYVYQNHKINETSNSEKVLARQVVSTKKASTNQKNTMPKEGKISIDWQRLQKINPKIKAWVYIPGTHVNAPILQGDDNQFYLHHNEHDQPDVSGQIFMNYQNQADFSDRNTIVYGHYMEDGSRFGDLNKYFDQAFLDAHQHVYFYTPTKQFVGTIFAVQSNNAQSQANTLAINDQTAFSKYIEYLQAQTTVQSDVSESQIDKVVTLWTCTEQQTTDDDNQPVAADKARTFVSVSIKEA